MQKIALGSPEKALEARPPMQPLFTGRARRWCIQRILEEYPAAAFVMLPIQTARVPRLRQVGKNRRRAHRRGARHERSGHGLPARQRHLRKFEVPDGAGPYLRDGLHPRQGPELMGRLPPRSFETTCSDPEFIQRLP